MQIKAVIKIIGILLAMFSFTMLVPIAVAFYFGDNDITPYLYSFGLTIGAGLLCWLPNYNHSTELKVRDGFLIVVLFWTVLSAFSALPFVFALHHNLSFTSAMFQSVSGFTTTGSTVFDNINRLPPALIYYQQQLQFLGGMGIIVLAVAILPMLGVGGMQLYRAETPGPMKEEKITPRITETAKTIWTIYVGLVVLCAIAYWFAGMPPFEAVEESFSTISTGGFSTHSTSFAFYHSELIELVAIIFMFLGGVNFSLHYVAVAKGNVFAYWRDGEFRAYLFIVVITCIISTALLGFYHVYRETNTAFIQSLFNIVSVMTTTGYYSADFSKWPLFIPFLIMLLGLLGACGGSTSGGMKVIRVLLLKRVFSREIKRLIHPYGVYPLKLGKKALPSTIVDAVFAFVAAYVAILLLSMMLLMATGIDLDSAFGAVAQCLGNIGVGIGKYGESMSGMNAFSKWVLIFDMITGRLEVFTVVLLFSRAFWRR